METEVGTAPCAAERPFSTHRAPFVPAQVHTVAEFEQFQAVDISESRKIWKYVSKLNLKHMSVNDCFKM